MSGFGTFYQSILDALRWLNKTLSLVFFWAGLFAVLTFPFYYFFANIRKRWEKGRSAVFELASHTLMLFVLALLIGAIWALPESTRLLWPNLDNLPSVLRLIEIAAAFLALVRAVGREHGEKRWIRSIIGHIVVIFAGFLTYAWTGVIFISLPILAAYYFSLYNLALVVLPASVPDDKNERWKRFMVLVSYAWGIQSPIQVAGKHAWAAPETRIQGDLTWDFSDLALPIIRNIKWKMGLLWTPAHQVAAISGGTRFKRADGPGLIFTEKLERPVQLFELRLQLRSNEINVVSRDGIGFKARVFAAFRIDPEKWSPEIREKFSSNSLLRDAGDLSYTLGSFPYSNLRVQAALGVTGSQSAKDSPTIYWDQWAMSVIEDQTRKVISQKSLDEMWRPANDTKYASAMDKIAAEIKEGASDLLRSKGVLLVASRVVNFGFSDSKDIIDEVSLRQINAWKAEWKMKTAKLLSEAQSVAENLQQEARVYAQSALLGAIAEALKQARDLGPDLSRYLLAARFFAALRDYAHSQSDEKVLREWEETFKDWQEKFYPNWGKEK